MGLMGNPQQTDHNKKKNIDEGTVGGGAGGSTRQLRDEYKSAGHIAKTPKKL